MQTIQLQIPRPCMQNWEAMKHEEAGRFCNACATTVIDFSAMSDAALLKFFSDKNNRDVCGRMHNDQLQTNLRPLSGKRKFYTSFVGLMISFILKWGVADAQKLKKEDVYASPLHGHNKPLVSVHTVQVPGFAYSRAVSVKILDENGNPLSSVRVQVMGTDKEGVTASNGSFVFLVDSGQDKVYFSAEGYQPKTITLNQTATHYQVVLYKKEIIHQPKPYMMGKIVVPRHIR